MGVECILVIGTGGPVKRSNIMDAHMDHGVLVSQDRSSTRNMEQNPSRCRPSRRSGEGPTTGFGGRSEG
eukprot:1455485-Pyramimonas_sp.AAC.1